MTTRRLRQLLPTLAAALVVAMAGCGGDEESGALLSQSRADTLLGLLDDAEEQFDEGACDELDQTLSELQQEVAGVSNDVDQEVRTALDDEASELAQLSVECEQAEEPAPPPVTVPEPTIPEETIPEETVPEETIPEETEPEETEPEEPPDEENGDDGDSSGPGSGGSGGSGGSSGSGSGSNGGVAPPGQDGGSAPPSAGSPDATAPTGQPSGFADPTARGPGGHA